jgi:hypothetical protein
MAVSHKQLTSGRGASGLVLVGNGINSDPTFQVSPVISGQVTATFTGSNFLSVSVSDARITATSLPIAYVSDAVTTNNSADNHADLASKCTLHVRNVANGSFTIEINSSVGFSGDYKINWRL